MAKISVTKRFTFSAAHYLPGHKGKCSGPHGHNFCLEVTVSGQLEDGGSSGDMVMDFGDLSEIVNTVINASLDHKMLNDVFRFRPTAENLVFMIANVIGPEIYRRKRVGVDRELTRVRLWETEGSYATWEL